MATTDHGSLDATAAWREELYGRSLERQGEPFSTISGVENEPLATPDSVELDYERDLGYPGVYPFTRGVYPSMYRGKLWTMRPFAGFGREVWGVWREKPVFWPAASTGRARARAKIPEGAASRPGASSPLA